MLEEFLKKRLSDLLRIKIEREDRGIPTKDIDELYEITKKMIDAVNR